MQYYFYEVIKGEGNLPLKAFIHSINEFDLHWHNEMEILLVLQGSVNIRVGRELFVLHENDIILINSNEIHNTCKTKEDNILLALQINPEILSVYYPDFKRLRFECKSFLCSDENQERFDVLRYHLAKILLEVNKKRKGYQLIAGSEIYLLASCLVDNFEHYFIEDEKISNISKDASRLKNIITYINENLEKEITLKDLADREQLSFYYLSHFIQKKLGMSFQQYLNFARLNKAFLLMAGTNRTLTEIAYSSGFSSIKSFNRLFKDTYGCSPNEYRKDSTKYTDNNKSYIENADNKGKRSRTYLDVDRSAALKKLFSYLKPKDRRIQEIIPSVIEEIKIDANYKGKAWKPFWKKLIGFGRAAEGLRKEWQDQLSELQTEIGFEYIRFHGIFSDDMMVFNFNGNGEIIYNWEYVDQLFDFFRKVGIRPFVELGFMPSEIRRSGECVFSWNANIAQPIDIRLWMGMVSEFIKHCINRYGRNEVENWYFEVWNEPDLENVFWIGTKEDYFEFYRSTALAVKSVDAELKVGGPSITHQTIFDNTWLEDFMKYCINKGVALDFISLHIYAEDYSSKLFTGDIIVRARNGENPKELINSWKQMQRIYHGKNHTADTLVSAKEKIHMLKKQPELFITEWNATAYGRNLILDTCFVSAFIIKNVLSCIGKTDALGFWTFTDIIEETKIGFTPFHGGFGLINRNGIKKPSYFAYYFLSKLGDEIIEQGEEYIITKKGPDMQIIAFNYAYYDDLFINGDTSALSSTDRYSVFEIKPPKEVALTIKGLSGKYKITRYKLDREHGSAFDEWIKMGAPECMELQEIAYLKAKAQPEMTIENVKLEGEYKEKLYLPVHGIELILLENKL